MPRLNSEMYSFSHSEMETAKDCKRRWMLQYYLKLRKRGSEDKAVPRDTGTLVHAALHEFYILGGLNSEDDIATERCMEFLRLTRDEAIANAQPHERKAVEETQAYAQIITEGYIEWLAETGADTVYDFTDGNGKVLSEVQMTAPGPVPGTQILGILDLAGTHRQSGDLFVMDTKVVASIEDMIKSLSINEQGPTYAILSKINDPDPDRGFRVVWNMLKRNKQTARANPPFYQRYELAINADQLRQFYSQLEGQMLDILRMEERLESGEHHAIVAYPRPSKDCSWKCPFMALCSQMNDPRSDAEWTINTYFTTPEQREAAKIVEQQVAQMMSADQPEKRS